MTGTSGGAMRRFKKRIANDGWKTSDDFKLKQGYIYVQVRAISARINQNYDGWPSEELKKSASTFVGKPCFVNHENYDPEKARGVIVAARYVDNGADKYIDTLMEIDAKRFPKLAHEIRTGGLDSVSMGAEAGFTICSYCGNKAYDVPDFCEHVMFHKGEKLSRLNRKTGRREDVLVYESCHKLSFFELSFVFDPADETAVASRVLVATRTASGVVPYYTTSPNADGSHRIERWLGNELDGVHRDNIKHPLEASDETEYLNQFAHEEPENYRLRRAKTAAECPPGKDCDLSNLDPSKQISADSPNNPLNQQGGGSSGGAGTSSGTPSTDAPKAIGGGELGKTPSVGGPATTAPGGVPLIKNPDGSYTSSDPAWAHLIDRESGGQNIKQSPSTQDVNSGGNEAFGIFQITPGTWSAHGGEGSVYDSTPEQQSAVAAEIFNSNPSGSDWGAGIAGREDAAALAQGLQPKAAGFSHSFEDRVLRTAGFKTAGECLPGKPCSSPQEEQISADSPNNPLNMGGGSSGGSSGSSGGAGTSSGTPSGGAKAIGGGDLGDPGASAGGSGGSPQAGDAKYMPSTKPLYDDLTKTLPGVDIGTYRVDDYHEHDHGAMDVMTSDPAQAEIVKQKAFDSGAPYVLWNQTQWNSDGTSSSMPDRGDPTQNHMDHVHTAPINASFERRVLVTAGFKRADKCHYCVGDAEEGFSSCSGHRKMEENKFTKKVLEAAGYKTAGEIGADSPMDTNVTQPIALNTVFPDVTQSGASIDQNPTGVIRLPTGSYEARVIDAYINGGPQMTTTTFEARVLRAWGETEAPATVDTLREEGSAPEDDNNDFYHYVEPPKELQTPDLSQATQIDREQDEMGQDTDGMPGPSSMDAGGGPPQQPQQQFMTLQIPIPQSGQAGAGGAPAIPTEPYQDQPPQPPAGPPPGPPGPPPGPQPPQQIAASTLTYFDGYFGRRISREGMNLQTLENGDAGFTKSRNPMKGTANMARSTLASRGKVVTAGRRQHFADGPLVDTGDQSRNDQGEQEEIFLSQTPPAEAVDAPTDDTPNISNTENNLVAKVQRGRNQLLRDAQALANYRRRTAGDSGGPVPTEVNPTVNTGPAAEELTGDDFESADPNADVQETQPKDASLHAFKQFDHWLASKTGRPSRQHTSATIRRAADDYSRAAGISVQAMYPALGIVLREARKNEKANTKGANMRKRSVDLEVAAPDGRVDVEAPTKDTTDAEAQASQFDLHDFGNNAGDNLADPDLSTDQNWAPGEANKTSKVKLAGGILAFRCAEAMIAAGLEPNTVERKYALAGEFEHMNRGLVQDRTALCERFAAVLQNERRKVASGSTRGAALKPPVPTGLTQGMQRSAATQRVAANDPRNDSTMFV